jgi:hypothetical protein
MGCITNKWRGVIKNSQQYQDSPSKLYCSIAFLLKVISVINDGGFSVPISWRAGLSISGSCECSYIIATFNDTLLCVDFLLSIFSR